MISGQMHHKFIMTIVAFSVVLALCLSGFHVSAASGTSIVIVSGPTQSVSPGSEFTLNITVQPVSAIAGAQFNLSYNPALVTVKNVSEGNLLKQNGDSTYFSPGRIDNTEGIITGVAGTITNPGRTVSTEGILAIITMVAGPTDANCPINLSKVILGDVNAQSVPVSTVNANITLGNGTNRPPILGSIGSKTVNAGSHLSFVVAGTDPDDDSLTYSASNLPAGAIFNPSSRTFSWTPTSSQAATYSNISFKVADKSLSDTENITIIVTSAAPSGGGGAFSGGGGPMPPGPIPPASIVDIPSDNTGIINTTVEVESEDGLVKLKIDSGTKGLTKDSKGISTIAIRNVQPTAAFPKQALGVGKIYDFEPDGATFDRSIKLTFNYDLALIPQGIDENTFVLATFDTKSGTWIDLQSTVNPNSHTITAEVNHFSQYCILTRAQPTIIENIPESTKPALKIRNITVSAPEFYVGETITIRAMVTNVDSTSSSDDIMLKINGVVEAEKNVVIGVGSEEAVFFDIIKNNPGTYTADINGTVLTFLVKLPQAGTELSSVQANSTNTNGPTPPNALVKLFSLSLLAKIIGGAFLLIWVIVILVVLRRNQLLKRGY